MSSFFNKRHYYHYYFVILLFLFFFIFYFLFFYYWCTQTHIDVHTDIQRNGLRTVLNFISTYIHIHESESENKRAHGRVDIRAQHIVNYPEQ